MARSSIDPNEIEGRHEKIRTFLAEQGLGALFAYSPPMAHQWGQTGHVSYLCGWANHDRIVDSAVVVPVQGPAVLLFAGLPFMKEQIVEVSPIKDLRLVRAVDPQAVAVAGGTIRDFAAETLAICQENGAAGKPVGVVGIENMSAIFYEALAGGLGQQLRRIDDIVAEMRSVKSPAEVEAMRSAARLSDLGFATMVKVARPGMRGIEIIAEMERAVRREGADHAQYWLASGPATDWVDTKMDFKPHQRVLREGDLMASCSYVLYQGYWCHGHRAGTLQRRCAALEKMYRITRNAQDAGLAELRPGTPVGHVARAIREKAAESGFQLQGGRVGHGMGMDYSERPATTETNQTPLVCGMTMVIHSAFSVPGSEKLFVPMGDVCHVTPDGPELLMKFPRDLFVAGE